MREALRSSRVNDAFCTMRFEKRFCGEKPSCVVVSALGQIFKKVVDDFDGR